MQLALPRRHWKSVTTVAPSAGITFERIFGSSEGSGRVSETKVTPENLTLTACLPVVWLKQSTCGHCIINSALNS